MLVLTTVVILVVVVKMVPGDMYCPVPTFSDVPNGFTDDFAVICLAAAEQAGTYREASVVVQIIDMPSLQYAMLMCSPDPTNPSWTTELVSTGSASLYSGPPLEQCSACNASALTVEDMCIRELHVCVCVCVHVHACSCMCLHEHEYTYYIYYVCMYVCMYVCIYVCTCTHTLYSGVHLMEI